MFSTRFKVKGKKITKDDILKVLEQKSQNKTVFRITKISNRSTPGIHHFSIEMIISIKMWIITLLDDCSDGLNNMEIDVLAKYVPMAVKNNPGLQLSKDTY